MASNLRESSAVGQVEPVGQTGVFRRPAPVGQGLYIEAPFHHRPPRSHRPFHQGQVVPPRP